MTVNPDIAFDLEARVLAARSVERWSWVTLAKQLYIFHEREAWKLLGWEKFTDWLGVPEVGIGRRTAYRLIQAWKFSVAQAITEDRLARLDLSKLSVVIPAVSEGRVGAPEALSDAEVLSRSDLIEKYGTPRDPTAQSVTGDLEECPDCGCMRKAAVSEQPASV